MGILGTATIIRGKGACELFVNGIRDEEVRRINELHTKEIETVKNELKKAKNRMAMMPAEIHEKGHTANKLVKLRFGEFERPSVLRRLLNAIELAWAYTWVYGVKYGVFGYWNEEEDVRIRRELNRRK